MIEPMKACGRAVLRVAVRTGPYVVALLLPGGALIAALVYLQRRRTA